MTTLEQFMDLLGKASPLLPHRMSSDQLREFSSAFTAALKPGGQLKRLSSFETAEQRWWTHRLLVPASAIAESLEQLLDLEVIARRFPYSGTRLTPNRFLRLVINVYLQEVYVLRDRVIAIFNSLSKDYRGTAIGGELQSRKGTLTRDLKYILKPLIEARLQHVHKHGYDTDGLNHLDALGIVATTDIGDRTEFQAIQRSAAEGFRASYRKERKRWVREIQQFNQAIPEVLDPHFELLTRLLFDVGGNLVYPPLESAREAPAADAVPRCR